MTIQECCGGIMSDNPDVTEGSVPYMIRRCMNKDEWNKTQCGDNCCDSNSHCIPTEQGGFCHDTSRNKYFRFSTGGSYNSDGIMVTDNEKQFLTENEARSQYPYSHENNDSILFSSNNRMQFDDMRYKRSYSQARRDIVNEFMNKNILGTGKGKGKGNNNNNEFFTPIEKIIILIVLVFICICLINYVNTTNRFNRYRKLFT